MALTQNASQTYTNAGLGTYAEATLANKQLVLAGGFQGATDITATTITTQGFATGKYAYFGSAQMTPIFFWAAGSPHYGTRSLRCHNCRADRRACRSTRCSTWAPIGVCSCAPTTRPDWLIPSRPRSPANSSDKISFRGTSGTSSGLDCSGAKPIWRLSRPRCHPWWRLIPSRQRPVGGVRGAEWGLDVYYRYSIFRGLQVSPDLQIYFNPAFNPANSPVAVFTIRSTFLF